MEKIQLFNQKCKLSTDGETSDAIMKGYATVYNQATDLGLFELSIDRGAFRESVENADDVVSLFNHDWNLVLGRTPSTLSLEWDHEYGLYSETILPEHELGKRVKEGIARGDLNQMSVAFFIQAEEFTAASEGEPAKVHVTKAKLEDVSAVTFGQYPETTLSLSSDKQEGLLKQMLEKHFEEQEVQYQLALSKYQRAHALRQIALGV